MKKTFPIILSSILAITVTSSVVHAAVPTQEQFPIVAKVQNLSQNLQNQQKLKVKAIQETLKKYKQLPTQRPYYIFGKKAKVYDAKPIILQCVKQYGTEVTVGRFAYCCGVADIANSANTCMELINQTIETHNKNVDILAKCMPENDRFATAGHYVWVNGVKKCASTQCEDGYSIAKDQNGKSKGFCIKADSSIDPKNPEDATPIVVSDEEAKQEEAKQEEAQTTLSDKHQQKIQENINENKCLEMGVTGLEMNKCKKDPDAYEVCKNIPNLKLVEFNQCMKDPKAFAQKRIDKANEESKKKELENKCAALGAKFGANKNLCMQDPDKYSDVKSQCESMEATGTKFDKCVTDPAEYKKQYELEKAAEEKGMNVRQYEEYMEEQETLEALKKISS